MKDRFDQNKQKISMADDAGTSSSNQFPEPVSRSFAFDEAFFEQELEESTEQTKPTVIVEAEDGEETELAYDFGLFGSSKHSSAVYRPKPKAVTPPEETPAEPEHFAIQSEPEEDYFSALFDSINEELMQMEAEPMVYEPQTESAETPNRGAAVSYDEFRAKFNAPEPEEEPAEEAEQDEEPQAEELPEEEPETAEQPLPSAAEMNIRLDTEAESETADEPGEIEPGEEDGEEDGFNVSSLEKMATEQQAEYFAEGEEPEPLTAPYSPKRGNFFTRNVIPLKGDPPAEIIRKIIMIAALLAVLGSAGYLFNDYVITPYRTANQIDELSELIDEENDAVVDDSLQKEYPGVEFPEGMLEKYAPLYARNPDFVGWLSIDALDISLPVVKAENNSKYLKTDFDGKKNKYGSLFVNASNNMDRLDMNTTIFGHNMKDTKMLGNLVHYRTVKGYQKAPLIEFNTIYADYKWKIFAVMLTNGDQKGDRGYLFNYMFTNLSSEAVLEEYLGEIKQRSLYYPEVDIALTDKILTISTCTYDFEDARLVILARMVRPGESTAVSGTVYGNENPRYPQAYYDKSNLNNPYFDATRWQPS